MPERQLAELTRTMGIFETMIQSHSRERDRIRERLQSAPEREQKRLEQRLEINTRTLEALQRARETMRQQLKALGVETVETPRELADVSRN